MTDHPNAHLKVEFEAIGTSLWKSIALTSDFVATMMRDEPALASTADRGQTALDALTEATALISQAMKCVIKAGIEFGLDDVPMPPPAPVLSLVRSKDLEEE